MIANHNIRLCFWLPNTFRRTSAGSPPEAGRQWKLSLRASTRKEETLLLKQSGNFLFRFGQFFRKSQNRWIIQQINPKLAQINPEWFTILKNAFRSQFWGTRTFQRTCDRSPTRGPPEAGRQWKLSLRATRKEGRNPSLTHPGIKLRPASASVSRAIAEKIFCFFCLFWCF